MKNKQLDKSTVPVGKKNGITGTGRQRQSNDSQQINKTDRDKWERKTHNGHQKNDKELKHRQLNKSTVPVGKKNGTTGTEGKHNQMAVSKLTKPTVTNGNEKRTTGTEKAQRTETQAIRQIYRASREKERHNGHRKKEILLSAKP